MAEQIKRAISDVTVTIDISADDHTSGAFDMRWAAGGLVMMPGTWTTADIGFEVCDTVDGTFQPLYDHDGNLLVISGPVASKAYEFPPELWGAHFVKLWSNAAGVDTAQAADRDILVLLKG